MKSIVIIFILIVMFFNNVSVVSASCDMSSRQIVSEINDVRRRHNVRALRMNVKLNKSANFKANDIINNKYWAHTNPKTGERFWVNVHRFYGKGFVGENLAKGYVCPNDVVNAWMNSKRGHRENMLDPRWTEIGADYTGGVTVTHFGRK